MMMDHPSRFKTIERTAANLAEERQKVVDKMVRLVLAAWVLGAASGVTAGLWLSRMGVSP